MSPKQKEQHSSMSACHWSLLPTKFFDPGPSIYLSIYLAIYLSVCLSICLSIYLSLYLSIDLSICLFVYLSVYLSIFLSIYLSVYLSICLSIYLSIYVYMPFMEQYHVYIWWSSTVSRRRARRLPGTLGPSRAGLWDAWCVWKGIFARFDCKFRKMNPFL